MVFSIFRRFYNHHPQRNLVPIQVILHTSLPPLASGNHSFTFCLCGFPCFFFFQNMDMSLTCICFSAGHHTLILRKKTSSIEEFISPPPPPPAGLPPQPRPRRGKKTSSIQEFPPPPPPPVALVQQHRLLCWKASSGSCTALCSRKEGWGQNPAGTAQVSRLFQKRRNPISGKKNHLHAGSIRTLPMVGRGRAHGTQPQPWVPAWAPAAGHLASGRVKQHRAQARGAGTGPRAWISLF